MTVLGPVGPNEVILGYDHKVHTLTVNGSATEGYFVLGEPGVPDNFTAQIAYNASSSTIQTALRTIPGWEAAAVTGSNPFTITLNSDRACYAPIEVRRNTTGFSVPITASSIPLSYPLSQPVVVGTVPPLAGKTIVASSDAANERTFQVKASEWLNTGPMYHGSYTVREQESASGAYFTFATTHLKGMLFGLPQVDTNTMAVYNGMVAGRTVDAETANVLKYHRRADGRVYSSTNAYPGQETTVLLGTVASPIAYGTLCRFRGTLFIPGGTGAGQYYYWASSTFTAQAVSGSSPFVSFAVLGDRLFSVDVAGQIRYTTSATPAAADWTSIATLVYRGTGSVLQLVRWQNPRTGNEAIILFASDGVYLVDEAGSGTVALLGDLQLPVGLPCDDSNTPYTSKVGGVKDGNLVFLSGLTVYSYNGSTLTDLRLFGKDGTSRYLFGNGNLMAPVALTVTRHYILVTVTGVTETSTSPMRPGSSAPNASGTYVMAYTDGWSPVAHLGSSYDSASCVVFSGNARRSYLLLDKIAMPWNDTLVPEDYRYGLVARDFSFMTGWFDRGQADIPKVFWSGFFDVREAEPSANQNITIYYQTEFGPDSASIGTTPVSTMVSVKDATGTNMQVIPSSGATVDGVRTPFYFERPLAADGATRYSRGLVARVLRLYVSALTSAASATSVSTTNGSTLISAPAGTFHPSDVGKAININTTTALNTVIVSVANSSSAYLADAPASTQSGRTALIYRYPVFDIIGVNFDAEYDRVNSFRVNLSLEGQGGISGDGRTPERMKSDLMAALSYRGGLPFAYTATQHFVVNVDSLTLNGGGTGLNPQEKNEPLLAGLALSERVPTR